MSLFKSTDAKLESIGFVKMHEDDHGVLYYKEHRNYTQAVQLMHKAYGWSILQSYDPNLFDSKGVGNTCIGLTYTEMKLFMKKMRELKMHRF